MAGGRDRGNDRVDRAPAARNDRAVDRSADRGPGRDERRDVGGSGYRDSNQRDIRDRGIDNRGGDRSGRQNLGSRDNRSDFRSDKDQTIIGSRDHRGRFFYVTLL
jgi:hypothetical protein